MASSIADYIDRSLNMNAAGIDVSSRKSTVAVLRPFGEVVRLPFDVSHSSEDLAGLARQLKALDGETRVVMEHTGRYYEPVANVLHEAGLHVSAVNPLLIREYGGNSLRRVKTDKADAVKIARYALDNWADLRDYTPMDTIRYDLKTLNRQFQLASKQKTATANNLIALQEQSFPGIRKCFDSPVRQDGTQKWVDFTYTFWHADCVRKHSLNAFAERYRKWCKRHGYIFKQSNAEEVYALAKSAVTLVSSSEVTKLLVQEAANQLTGISHSVETYRAEMNRLASMLPEYPVVMEMYGVGESFGPQLMARLETFAALSTRNPLWPLPVSIRCRINPARRMFAVTVPRSAAHRIFARRYSTSWGFTSDARQPMSRCTSSSTASGSKGNPSTST